MCHLLALLLVILITENFSPKTENYNLRLLSPILYKFHKRRQRFR